MTLDAWIQWAFRPCSGRHSFHSLTLANQAVRDMGSPVDHADFVDAMNRAGYRVARQFGDKLFFNCRDTAAKRKYYRRKYVMLDELARHPLDAGD